MLINFNIQWFSQIIFLGESNSSRRESSVGNKQPQTLVGLFLYPENGINTRSYIFTIYTRIKRRITYFLGLKRKKKNIYQQYQSKLHDETLSLQHFSCNLTLEIFFHKTNKQTKISCFDVFYYFPSFCVLSLSKATYKDHQSCLVRSQPQFLGFPRQHL